jgi:hypothetical protein
MRITDSGVPDYVTGYSFVHADSPAVQQILMGIMDRATITVSFS